MSGISFTHFSSTGIRDSIPLSVMAKAFQEKAKEQGNIPLNKIDSPALVYWDADLGPGHFVIQSKSGEDEQNITPTKKKGVTIWLPANCIARFQPDDRTHNGWAIAINKNGRVRVEDGYNVGISKEEELLPENAPAGKRATLKR